MGRLVFAAVLGAIAFSVLLAAALLRSQRPGPIVSLLRFGGLGLGALALALAVGSPMVVIDPGEVGVRHAFGDVGPRSEEHTSELQSQSKLVCRLFLEKKKKNNRHVLLIERTLN